MKCSSCRKPYSAAISQPAPGGSSAPGVFFITTLLSAALTVGLFWADVAAWKWLSLGVTAFIAFQVLVAWSDCRGPAGLSPCGGERCPFCDRENTVWPWSL